MRESSPAKQIIKDIEFTASVQHHLKQKPLPSIIITAARPAYAGTEGCYEMLVYFFIFFI